MTNISDFTIIGAGIFGLTTALELARRGYSVEVLNAGPVPDPAAASTDISKIVRMEYGSDRFYMDVVDQCFDTWEEWNMDSGKPLYNQTGFLLLCSESMESPAQSYEKASYDNLISFNKAPERLNRNDIKQRYPAFNSEHFVDGFFHERAGWANASETLRFLRHKCEELSIEVFENSRIMRFEYRAGRITTAIDSHGRRLPVGHLVMCAGSFTTQLFPWYRNVMKASGHPVYHLLPPHKTNFTSERFPVFAADISNTGWYGFPVHAEKGVIKIANHGVGIHRSTPFEEDIQDIVERSDLNIFLSIGIPSLLDSPVNYKRYCYYSDTFDGHFWIDRDMQFDNLTVAAGGSGHAFKMGPVLGKWVADAVEGFTDKIPERFQSRAPLDGIGNVEEARFSG